MEQPKGTSQEPNPKAADTEIHHLLNELIKNDSVSAPKENTVVSKTSTQKTPLANLKTILSKADAVAKENKGAAQNIQTLLPHEEQTSSPSAEPLEFDSVIRLHKLIEAYRAKKKTQA